MWLRAGECRVLKLAGIPPGPFPEFNYEHLTLQREPRDSLLFFYTDGLTDARNTQQAEFEAEGLPQVCGTMQRNCWATSSQPSRDLWATACNLTI